MLKCYDLADGRVRLCPDGQLGLIQVYSAPTDEEKRYLVEQCGIDEHTLASALDEDEISRIEYEPNHIAVIMKRPRNCQVDRRMTRLALPSVRGRAPTGNTSPFGRNVSAAALDELPIPEGGRVDELLLRQEDFDAIRRRVAQLLGMEQEKKKSEKEKMRVGGTSRR